MKLGGLLKTTLLDYPERIACTVFTQGCNLRCPFCHNSSLVLPDRYAEEISEADFFSFINSRKGILDGVVVSGGEPTVQADITGFLYKIKEYGFAVKLDTNGAFPKKLREIISNGLIDYVAMDIKNSPAKYDSTTACNNILTSVSESIDIIMSSGIEYEFRTTAVTELHTTDDFLAIGDWISGANKYFIQSYTDSGDILTPLHFSSPTAEMLQAFLQAAKVKIPNAELRGV